MAKIDPTLLAQVKTLSAELDKRVTKHKRLDPYVSGDDCDDPQATWLPPAITQARLTKVYRYLMPVAGAPWGSLITDSKLDRLEISGLRDADKRGADALWEVWQANHMDSESKLGHGAALLDGRCYATVWTDADGKPDIALDDMTQMVVQFAEGSRHKRVAALRRWAEGDRVLATLYLRDGIYKFQGPKGSAANPSDEWEKRQPEGDKEWPIPNPMHEVPVVEVAINRRLKPGAFPYARGEFAHCLGLIDRVNVLTFLGLVVALWMGFPLRGVIGEKIQRRLLKDDEGNPLIDEETGKEKTEAVSPVDMRPDSFAQFENPDAKIFEWKAADRKNLSVFDELDQLAVITKTPRHYFPMENGMQNLSAEAITASEGGMHAAVTSHKSTLAEGWEEVLRLAGKILDTPVALSPSAELTWKDQQARSLAERADAASKLGALNMPFTAIAEYALDASQAEIARWQTEASTSALGQLITQVQNQNGQTPQPGQPGVPMPGMPPAPAGG